MNTSDVELERINLTMGGNHILRDVSLHVEGGSFVTLLGPSGSGKSTTLNVIAGFLDADSGAVRFGGRDVRGLAPGARQLGVVFQNYAIFPHMTVGENVRFPLLAQRWKGDHRRRVAEMLDLVKLGGFEHRRASSLSGGQLQRVALARALAPSPQVLLLDEPLSALDKQLREAMQLELKSIQREVGVTTISVTHDQSEALSMSDHVVVMNGGRIEQQGTAVEMYSHPSTEFLARFLGEVNLVPVDSDGVLSLFGVRLPEHRGRLAVIRPEELSIVELGGSGENQFRTVVEGVQFQGGSCRLELRAPRLQDPLVIRTPYGGIGSLPTAGQEVTVAHTLTDVHTVAAS